MLLNKILSRAQTVAVSAAFRLVSSLGNVIISLFIIRIYSAHLWGELVYYILMLDLGFVVINWGHSFYLSRQFSLNPQSIRSEFHSSLISRTYILMAFAILILLLPIRIEARFILIGWSVARFIYQSFDPIIQYYRRFFVGLCIELLGIVCIIALVTFPAAVSVLFLLASFAIAYAVRSLLVVIIFRQFLTGLSFNTSVDDFLKPALPFLLLTLTAMLQQRTDLYVAALYLDSSDLGSYQVFLSLLLLSHVGASLLLSPYARNLFRMSHQKLRMIERQFMTAGLLLSMISIVVIFLLTKYVFLFQLSWVMFSAGYFYVLFYYFYQVRNYQFMKEKRQKEVAVFSLAGCALSFLLGMILVPKYKVEGAMIAGLSTQTLNVILHLRVRFKDRKQVAQTPSTIA